MGTLFDQPIRGTEIRSGAMERFMHDYLGVKDVTKATPDQWRLAAEVATASVVVAELDVKDEQLAGFGHIAEDFTRAMHDVATALSEIATALEK